MAKVRDIAGRNRSQSEWSIDDQPAFMIDINGLTDEGRASTEINSHPSADRQAFGEVLTSNSTGVRIAAAKSKSIPQLAPHLQALRQQLRAVATGTLERK